MEQLFFEMQNQYRVEQGMQALEFDEKCGVAEKDGYWTCIFSI